MALNFEVFVSGNSSSVPLQRNNMSSWPFRVPALSGLLTFLSQDVSPFPSPDLTVSSTAPICPAMATGKSNATVSKQGGAPKATTDKVSAQKPVITVVPPKSISVPQASPASVDTPQPATQKTTPQTSEEATGLPSGGALVCSPKPTAFRPQKTCGIFSISRAC